MRLSYLGVNYQDAPSVLEVTDREIGSTYRGQDRQFRYVRHIPKPTSINNRQSRGISYRTPQPVCAVPVRNVSPTHNMREVLDEMMSSHRRSIQLSLEHRLKVAKAKGDQNLVRLLEAESKQMMLTFQ